MRELTERRIEIFQRDPDELGVEILRVAEKMHSQGWFFVESQTDSLLECIYLFFEREIDVDELEKR